MDRRSFLICVPLFLCLGAFSLSADAKDKPEKKPKPVMFVVAQTGPESFEAIPAKGLKKHKADMAKEHKEAVKAWKEAKKAAKKAKEKFTDKKPKAKALKIVAQNLKGQEEADAHIAKLLEAIRKAKEKKEGKKKS
tara:strand:+ start:1600 stop:2007 length:408 start_codon:yes stop_codon:yes gene_type:complete